MVSWKIGFVSPKCCFTSPWLRLLLLLCYFFRCDRRLLAPGAGVCVCLSVLCHISKKCLCLPTSLLIQLGSLWNLKLKLFGSQLVDPTYPGHPLCSTSALWNPLYTSISLYLCQIISDLYETWNLSFYGPNWLIPLILSIPSVLSAPSGTLWSPLEPL